MPEENNEIDTLRSRVVECFNNLNIQLASVTGRIERVLDPSLPELKESIDKSSSSATRLGIIIIILTVVATIISCVSWYSGYVKNKQIENLTKSQANCILTKAQGGGEILTKIAIKLCTEKRMDG